MFSITMRQYTHARSCQQSCTCPIAAGVQYLNFPLDVITHLQLIVRLEPNVQNGSVIRQAMPLRKIEEALSSTQRLFSKLSTIEIKIVVVYDTYPVGAARLIEGMITSARTLTGIKAILYRGKGIGEPENIAEKTDRQIAEAICGDAGEERVFVL